MSSSFYGARPWRTQGYPLSLGEIITPRRGDKSTEPAPYSPSITANLFYWYSNDLSAWMLSRQGKAFSEPPLPTQLAIQHIYNIKICLVAPPVLPSPATHALIRGIS